MREEKKRKRRGISDTAGEGEDDGNRGKGWKDIMNIKGVGRSGEGSREIGYF